MDRLNFRSDDITTLLNDSNTYAAGNRLLDAIQRLTASNKKLLGRLVYNAKRNENCLDAKRLLFCGLRFFWDHEKATYEANFTDTLRDLLTQHLDQSAENQPLNVPVAAEFSQ